MASITTAMLQEGTVTRSSPQIADEFEFMGSRLTATAGREQTTLGSEALSRHWPKALELVADLARNAAFPPEELDRIRTQRLTMVRRLRDDANALADHVMPMLLHGGTSPYGHPLSGTEAALEAVSRDDLVAHFRRGFTPGSATLVVVGDVTLDGARALAEEHLGTWAATGAAAEAHTPSPEPTLPSSTTLYLLDKPGSAQSVIVAGHVGVARSHPDYFKLLVLNHAFGGQFTGRLNMNLRQNKGYSYGYRSWIEWRLHSSLLLAGGAVQTAVTRESVEETLREFADIHGDRPLEESEFQAAKESLLRQFPSSFETSSQVLDQLTRVVSMGLPDDYHRGFMASVEAVSLDGVRQVARERVESDRLTLLVVGDAAVVEPGLRGLGLPLRTVDHEGRVL
jgi:zinc protease